MQKFLWVFGLINAVVGSCPPVPQGVYRAALGTEKFLTIMVRSGYLRMEVETEQVQLVKRAIVYYEFDSDCELKITDKYSRDDFADLRVKIYEASRMLTVENIRFDYAESKFVIGSWLSVPRASSAVPMVPTGVYKHTWLDIGASLEVVDTSKMIFVLPINGELKRVKAHYTIEKPGRIWIMLDTDDMVSAQYALNMVTNEWPRSRGFNATYTRKTIKIAQGVFERD